MSRSVRTLAAMAGTWLALGALLAHASATPARAATEHVVDIANVAFGPANLTISVGDTVTWTNSDSMPHTATDEDDRFDSGNMDPGQAFSFTFTTPGTYTYRCDYHSNMAGTIVVQEAAVAPPASAPAASAPATSEEQPAAASSNPVSPATQPDTATALPAAGTQLPALLMGLGLLVMAVSVLRVAPAPGARDPRPAGGWRR